MAKGPATRPPLSSTPSARSWLRRLQARDQTAAASLIDALVLLNDDDVASAIRSELRKIAESRNGIRRKAALYAEREYGGAPFFTSITTASPTGKARLRAVGKVGPSPVKPSRGSTRVGSEGWISFLISQAVESNKGKLLNNPGPDRIRSHKIGLIVIVTDFIGSGERIRSILDKLSDVPTVRSWASNHWIKFSIVAAAGTSQGIENVRSHRTKPSTHVTHVVPTLFAYHDQSVVADWIQLTNTYGPKWARGAGPAGYKDGGALVAFSYRTPNNTPLLLHVKDAGYKPLFEGAPSDDMRPAFGLPPLAVRVRIASGRMKTALAEDLSSSEGRIVVLLRAIRGKWREHAEVELAERTGLSTPEILEAKARAQENGLLSLSGRLSDEGHKLIRAGLIIERRRPDIPTNASPYYPSTLRALR